MVTLNQYLSDHVAVKENGNMKRQILGNKSREGKLKRNINEAKRDS